MPLETATYIPDLVTSNPAHSDGLNNADAHLRLIKGAIKATFPNFTDIALNSTQAQIDEAVVDVNTEGVTLLAPAVNFVTNTSDGFGNPVAGTVSVVAAGSVSASFTTTASTFNNIFGPGAAPIGVVMIWPFNELPTGFGVWAWCNGAAVSRTTYATYAAQCATDGYPYGNGDGSTTVNVPNYQEVTLVGRSTMGGAASPGLLGSIATGVKQLLGAMFGLDTYTVQRSDLPNVAPTFTGTQSTVNVSGSTVAAYSSATFNSGTAGNPATYSPNTTITLNSTGQFTPAGTIQSLNGGVTQTAVPTHQPSKTVNFIVRIG